MCDLATRLKKLQSDLIDVFRKERYYKMSARQLAKELLENHVDDVVADFEKVQQQLQDLIKERPHLPYPVSHKPFRLQIYRSYCHKAERLFEKLEKILGVLNGEGKE